MIASETDFAARRPDVAAALAALTQLGDVLLRENAALRTRNARALVDLGEEKRAAVSACEQLLDIGSMPTDDAAVQAAGATLIEVKGRLAALLEENQQRLRVAISANRRLVETIAAAVHAKAPGADAYASNGRPGCSAIRNSNAPALTFSRAL